MSEIKTSIQLVATKIEFNYFSIIYTVELPKGIVIPKHPVVLCPKDIVDKGIILKPTLLSKDNMKVVYTPSNVKPHFYQGVLNKISPDLEFEHQDKLDEIYLVGDVVGIIFSNTQI